MVRQMQDPEGSSFSLRSRESRGVSLFSYLSDASPAFERGSQMHINKQSSLHLATDDDLTKSLPEEGGDDDDDDDWRNGDPDTGPPSPDDRRDSILLFQRYSTPDILRQNGGNSREEAEAEAEVSPGLEPDTESGLNVTQDTDGELVSQAERSQQSPERLEEPPEEVEEHERDPKRPEASPAQRRAVAQRVSTLLAALSAALEEEGCAEAQLKDLERHCQRFHSLLKVSAYL